MNYIASQSFYDSRFGNLRRGAQVKLTESVAKPYKLKGLLIEKMHPVIGACKTIVCIASGPSLTKEDADLVHAWRDQSPTARKVIVTNTTYQLCPWADILYAMDRAWWDVYIEKVKSEFSGKLFTIAKQCHGIEVANIETYANSGAGAIALAASLGVKKIIMLGYDCKHSGRKKHWHGDHPPALKNAGAVKQWPIHFAHLSRKLRNVNVLNCSRVSALECFPHATLEQVLDECD